MDEKIEALIGPEPVVDPEAEAALARKVQAEDSDLRIRIFSGVMYVVIAFAVVFTVALGPILAALDRSEQLLLWIALDIPLFAFAGRAFTRSRFPLGRGHAIEGARARSLAAAIVMLGVTIFFWAGLAEEAWRWVVMPGW